MLKPTEGSIDRPRVCSDETHSALDRGVNKERRVELVLEAERWLVLRKPEKALQAAKMALKELSSLMDQPCPEDANRKGDGKREKDPPMSRSNPSNVDKEHGRVMIHTLDTTVCFFWWDENPTCHNSGSPQDVRSTNRSSGSCWKIGLRTPLVDTDTTIDIDDDDNIEHHFFLERAVAVLLQAYCWQRREGIEEEIQGNKRSKKIRTLSNSDVHTNILDPLHQSYYLSKFAVSAFHQVEEEKKKKGRVKDDDERNEILVIPMSMDLFVVWIRFCLFYHHHRETTFNTQSSTNYSSTTQQHQNQMRHSFNVEPVQLLSLVVECLRWVRRASIEESKQLFDEEREQLADSVEELIELLFLEVIPLFRPDQLEAMDVYCVLYTAMADNGMENDEHGLEAKLRTKLSSETCASPSWLRKTRTKHCSSSMSALSLEILKRLLSSPDHEDVETILHYYPFVSDQFWKELESTLTEMAAKLSKLDNTRVKLASDEQCRAIIVSPGSSSVGSSAGKPKSKDPPTPLSLIGSIKERWIRYLRDYFIDPILVKTMTTTTRKAYTPIDRAMVAMRICLLLLMIRQRKCIWSGAAGLVRHVLVLPLQEVLQALVEPFSSS